MGTVTFKMADVKRVALDLTKATKFSRSYEERDKKRDGTPKFQIVGDNGIYLMNNAYYEKNPTERNALAYAKGCDPDINEDYYENKVRLFGGDDGVVEVPISWIKLAFDNKAPSFRVRLNKRSISLVENW